MSDNETNMNNETFVYMGGDMVVPQDVVRVRVHPSVTVIPEKAFYQRSRLREVELCDGLLEIGNYAFSNGLLFSGGNSLTQISIPSSVRTIGDNAFSNCKKLKEVILCEGLLEIGNWAFCHCEALKSIRIPSTVTSIHECAFFYCGGMKEVVLCEGLLAIGMMAFIECTSLKQITIPSSVSMIGKTAFKQCRKLERVDLCEGLVEVGDSAFYGCGMKEISIPLTVKTIDAWAFAHVPLTSLHLPDGVSSIADHAFWNGELNTVRIPPLVNTITGSMCRSVGLLSMELPESIKWIEDGAFNSNTVLRNLAIPLDTEIGNDAFKDCLDLQQLGSESNITKALKHRFDILPIHKMLYYQSYSQGRITRSQFDDPSIKQQDCLGMNPLHILACSTTENLELYRLLIDKHPESLITKDRWGALPLLYAVWRDAGKEIVQFLVQSYKSIFPNYVFDWTMMMETLARANVSDNTLKCLHSIQIKSFPDQDICWDILVENAIHLSNPDNHDHQTDSTFRRLVTRSMTKRVWAMGNKDGKVNATFFKQLAAIVGGRIARSAQGRRDFMTRVHNELEACEDKYNRLREAFTMIELVLWNNKMDDCFRQQKKTRRSKKMRMDDSDMRKQCRIKCGAETNIMIRYIMPFLDVSVEAIHDFNT